MPGGPGGPGRPKRQPLILPDRVTLTQAGEAYVALFGGMLIALASKAHAAGGLLSPEYLRDAEVAAVHYREFEGMRGRLVLEAMKIDPEFLPEEEKAKLIAAFQGRALEALTPPTKEA